MPHTLQPQVVLILEREDDLFSQLQPTLQSQGHHVYMFRNGDLLVEFMDEATGNNTGLIIINADCLPENVTDVVQKAKHQTHVMDIVIVSKNLEHKQVVNVMREQASDYILRSNNIDSLLDILKTRLNNLPAISFDLYQKYIDKYKPTRKFQEEMLAELKDRITRLDATQRENLDKSFQLFGSDTPPTVLVAEDEPDYRANLRILLDDDYTVLEAVDGEEVLDQVRNHPEIECILLDVHMPKMKGDQVLLKVKEIDPTCEVVILTGFEETEIALHALKNGASDYLNKPAKSEDILAKIGQAIQLRQNKKIKSIYLPIETRLDLFTHFFTASKKLNRKPTSDDISAFFPELRQFDTATYSTIDIWSLPESEITAFMETMIHKSQEVERRQEEKMREAIRSGKSWAQIEAEFSTW